LVVHNNQAIVTLQKIIVIALKSKPKAEPGTLAALTEIESSAAGTVADYFSARILG
jgi:hypothetical protein